MPYLNDRQTNLLKRLVTMHLKTPQDPLARELADQHVLSALDKDHQTESARQDVTIILDGIGYDPDKVPDSIKDQLVAFAVNFDQSAYNEAITDKAQELLDIPPDLICF